VWPFSLQPSAEAEEYPGHIVTAQQYIFLPRGDGIEWPDLDIAYITESPPPLEAPPEEVEPVPAQQFGDSHQP
jgi:hypothetical protein